MSLMSFKKILKNQKISKHEIILKNRNIENCLIFEIQVSKNYNIKHRNDPF